MSLALPPQPFFEAGASPFDPFGPNVDLEVEPIAHSGPDTLQEGIFAPQGRVPVSVASLVPPQALSRPTSRPDFIRGFGIDIPEEEEPEEVREAEPSQENIQEEVILEYAPEIPPNDGTATALQSRFHSRHVSKLSTALSIRSSGALEDEEFIGEEVLVDVVDNIDADHSDDEQRENLDLEDPVGEWTGSEDVYMDETSDGEGVSFPSKLLLDD